MRYVPSAPASGGGGGAGGVGGVFFHRETRRTCRHAAGVMF
ncbi:hypothetical protein [Caballeronia sp. ATUFL_F2_KS9A]|nr:hypothetical protein [Caballeronia sp. ATUFL_F2_KS9A]